MLRIDHLVINIDEKYQIDNDTINSIRNSGYPYEPKWGKGTKGFKASNIWIGQEYFEMIRLLKKDGGGWRKEWVEKYNKGHRGLICIIFETNDLDKDYHRLKQKGVEVTEPEFLKFKWFFNLFTRTMPWRNSYISFFEGIPLQISFQQMKDDKSRAFMEQYMVPNSTDNKINGIKTIIIKGRLTASDKRKIKNIFEDIYEKDNEIIIKLTKDQKIIFKDSNDYRADVFTYCESDELKLKEIIIENLTISNFMDKSV
ncbi:hypothetical protein [Tissierella carlieri]|uniref:Glyoxalase-like domain-containing protein n=2 Tax=Tissierella carlieri TaxID=689904 RepID=A0ABT1SBA5_9FIRM|nr:hypothetical protein [Tissierella carlieri]MCQ4923617.1 hypothetical protein [Tissierella carlieri]